MSITIDEFENVIATPRGCGKKSSLILIFLNKKKAIRKR